MKQAIVKINLGPAGAKRVRRSPLIGAIIIADEVSPVDNQRYVVIERSVAKAVAPKLSKGARRPNLMPDGSKPEPDAAVSHA